MPVTATDDERRREIVLNSLLLASLGLAVMAFLFDVAERIVLGASYRGLDITAIPAVVVLFGGLLALSRSGRIDLPAYVLIGIYYLLASYSIFRWGILIPQGLLLYALVITLSSILASPRVAVAGVCLVISTLLTVYGLQRTGHIHPNLYWLNEPFREMDAGVFSVTLLVIFFVSWLSKRQIDHSFARAYASEQALLRERDLLEETVEERTAQLKEVQRAEMLQLYEMAELGKVSAAMLHDLLNPLSTVSLSLEQAKSRGGSELLDRAVRNTKWIERFVENARRQITQSRTPEHFSLAQEAREVIALLDGRLSQANVSVRLREGKGELSLHGDPLKFQRLLINLLINSIDAYQSISRTGPGRIELELGRDGETRLVSVQDRAGGISPADLPHVFEAFYTTKRRDQGTGIGLAVCKEIAEGDFGGTIDIASLPGSGTRVSVSLLSRHEATP